MAMPISVDTLLKENIVESARIEFKEGFNPDRIIRTICTFANDIDNIGGGYIVIGVGENNGQPVYPQTGIETNKIDTIQKELLNYCSRIRPRYLPVVEPAIYEGSQILIIWVKKAGMAAHMKRRKLLLQKIRSIFTTSEKCLIQYGPIRMN